jgi:photosystem II stability/assembly factor-like uncharacterized protein
MRNKSALLLVFVILFNSMGLTSSSRPVAAATGWTDISSHVVSTRGTPNFTSVVFIGEEGWIGSGNFPEIYYTQDGGATFEVQTLPTEINALAMRSLTEGYAGGQNGRIYRTTDGGENWQSLGTTGNPVRSLSCPPNGAACYSVGDHGSATIITGTVLTALTTGLVSNLRSVHFPFNSDEGWLCGGAIIRHFTGGAWQADQTYPTLGYNAIGFADAAHGWALGDTGIIIHTVTGGKFDGNPGTGWLGPLTPPQTTLTLNGISVISTNEAWAVGDTGTVLHTTNSGQTWALEADCMTVSLLTAVHVEDSNTVYVVGNNGALLKYSNTTIPLDHWVYLPMVTKAGP